MPFTTYLWGLSYTTQATALCFASWVIRSSWNQERLHEIWNTLINIWLWLADGKVSTGMINVLLYPSWMVTEPTSLLSQNPHPSSWKKMLKCLFRNKSWLKFRPDIHQGHIGWKTARAKLCEMMTRTLTCQELFDLIWWWSELISLIYFCKWNNNGSVFFGFNASRSFKTPHACFLSGLLLWAGNLHAVIPLWAKGVEKLPQN
jgi:hypothetical protein